ncbi:MAG TPA: C25 family cysteine peptidase [Myxococcota bacterium]|nr:C25 family cysteine peptidase [Myxococcota bacterium]
MKRFSFLMIAAALWLLAPHVQAASIEMEIDVGVPVLWLDDHGFTHVQIDGYQNLGKPGQPELPGRALRLLVPPGQRVESVSLRHGGLVSLGADRVVFPRQRPWPLSMSGPIPFTEPDASVYSGGGQFPAEIASGSTLQYLRGFAIERVLIRPVVYRPESGEILYAPSLHVTLTTAADRDVLSTGSAYRGLARDFARVADVVDNPAGLSAYKRRLPSARDPEYRYVIVTSGTLAACGGVNNLQALLADKQGRGITTRIENMSDILTGYSGVDDAEKVRNFIIDMHQNHGSDYVLLAGDADLQQVGGETQAPIVPARGMFGDLGDGYIDYNIPSDLYYAALDGNFDADGDDVYGEDNDNPDLYAEVWVGRAPVDSCSEVANFVRKTLLYQNAGGAWLQNVWFLGEYLFPDYFGKDDLQYIENSSSAQGIDTKGFSENSFFQINTLYDRDLGQDGWGASQALSVFNGGSHLINHLGHSYTNYAMRTDTDQIDSGLNNSLPFFAYSQGCYPGAFDNRFDDGSVYWQDSYAEHMLLGDHGAFALVMNTRYGLGGSSNYFHRFFWDAVFRNGQTHLGAMLAWSREQNAGWISDVGIRWVYYETTLFGDPELSVHTNSGSTDPMIGLSPSSLTFNARVGGGAPPDQSVGLSNLGAGSLNWQAAWSAGWLSVTPGTGSAPSTLTFSIDASGLAVGSYPEAVSITAPGAVNSPQQVAVELNVFEVPAIVAPWSASIPTVNGTIGPGEYDDAVRVDVSGATNWMKHTGDKLFIACDISSDSDDDDYDQLGLYLDNDNNDLWPTAAAQEGLYYFWKTDNWFAALFNNGSGVQNNDWENPVSGVQKAFGMSAGHRVIEVSLDLSASHLQLAPGDTFGLLETYDDFTSSWDWAQLWNWPENVTDIDDCILFANVTLGTQVPVFSIDPAFLAFEAVQHGALPAGRIVAVANAGGGTLGWTATKSGNWFDISPASGTAPSSVTITPNSSDLSVGFHAGSVEFSAPGAQPVTLDLSYTLSAPPSLDVSPASLEHADQLGGGPVELQLLVINDQLGSMQWTIAENSSWISVNPASGTTMAGIPTPVSVVLDPAGLSEGLYEADLTVTAPEADNSPRLVHLIWTLTSQPVLSVSPESFIFTAKEQGQAPAAQTLHIENSGTGSMNFAVTCSAAWLSCAPLSGQVPTDVVVTVDPAGLAAGEYSGSIEVVSDGALGSPAQIGVTLLVTSEPLIAASPSELSFTGQVGESAPPSQTVQIDNAGTGTLEWTIACPASWLDCSPASGSGAGTLTVSVDPHGIGAGTYQGAVIVTAVGAINSPFELPVSLTLEQTAQPVISVSPASVSFTAAAGGPAPDPQAVQVTNSGTGELAFTVECPAPWLSCTPASGVADASLSLSANTSGLAGGTYNALAKITADATNERVDVPVTLVITDDNSPPPVPELVSPDDGAEVGELQPVLTLRDVVDPDGDSVSYTFEIFEAGSALPLLTLSDVTEQPEVTSVTVGEGLVAGKSYNWRARATDGKMLAGQWSEQRSFTVTLTAGCACSSSGNRGTGFVLLLGLLLGLTLTRRRGSS